MIAKRRHENIITELKKILQNRSFKHWKVKINEVQKQAGDYVQRLNKALMQKDMLISNALEEIEAN